MTENKKEISKALKRLLVLIAFVSLFSFLLLTTIQATTSGGSEEANLTIWDQTDLEEGSLIRLSNTNITFFANLTNSTGSAINESGNCTIKFDYTGSYGLPFNATFNASSLLWTYTTLISYKGVHQFQVNCTSIYGNVTLNDSFIIDNSAPEISKQAGGGYIDLDGNTFNNDYLQCTEDALCAYNLSANVTEYDLNDVLTFGLGTNTTLTNYTFNTTTGILSINYTNDVDIGNGNKQIDLNVEDSDSFSDSGFLRVNVTLENDKPYFLNLGGQRVINKSGIDLILSAIDEELDTNYTFNVSFPSCTHSVSNPPTGPDNCTLFNLTYYNGTATNISFSPEGNWKGEYEINFSVTDYRNASYSTLVNWTVSWNDAPHFVYACEDEESATEDAEFTCYLNVTDLDEENNLTFSANYTWFTFNGTLSNQLTVLEVGTGNFSALVNFTPTDAAVGNWSVNITVTDTGAPNATIELNSTTLELFIANVNDTAVISDIPNVTVYNSTTSYQVSVNVTDDDFLVTDKNVKNETITFISNNSNVAVSSPTYYAGTNLSIATISFDPNDLGAGVHAINITAHDRGNFSVVSDVFTITVIDNDAPQWSSSTATFHNLTEDIEFYLNLSQNVTDTGDDVNFTLAVLGGDTDFTLTISQKGIINITPTDIDVGTHRVEINATDGKSITSKEFNFTVNNVNDAPTFLNVYLDEGGPPGGAGGVDVANRLIWIFEDNLTSIQFMIEDDDLMVPTEQAVFYQESYTFVSNLTGENNSLFSFQEDGKISANRFRWDTPDFTPYQSDVGVYNLTINVTDSAGESVFISFNLTVNETLQPPNLTAIDNAVLSILGEIFYVDVNASDEEDGSDAPDGNLTFTLTSLTSGGTFLTVNATTGVMNLTTTPSYAGLWEYELTVNDTSGAEASDRFNLTIYDYPVIFLPISTYNFSMKENVTTTLNFTANHTVQDNLNFTLIINSVEKNTTSGYGNATDFLWAYTPNFTMETTCSGMVNLTLNVSNPKLSNTTNWLVEINHTDAPLRFLQDIPSMSVGTPATITLSDYFYDDDATDSCINQTIGFIHSVVNGSTSGGAISVSITNWTNAGSPSAVFSATTEGSANFSVMAYEYNISNSTQQLNNLTSNNFSVSLTVSESTTITPVSSGGGGSTKTKIVSLKIIVPEPVSAKQKDKLIIPLGLENDGDVDLKGVLLEASVAKDGTLRKDLVASFDQSFFDKLEIGTKENITLIVDIDTSTTGLFEVTINATVEDPDYSDWAKLYIEIEEDRDVLERIIFTEEFMIGNPECAELMDLINDAKQLFYEGKAKEALEKAESSLEACRKAITQPPRPRIYERLGDRFLGYTAIASLAAFVLGFTYYTFKKITLKRKINAI
ncbi:MAG: hypothetical protein ABH864_03330 [archaeon]